LVPAARPFSRVTEAMLSMAPDTVNNRVWLLPSKTTVRPLPSMSTLRPFLTARLVVNWMSGQSTE